LAHPKCSRKPFPEHLPRERVVIGASVKAGQRPHRQEETARRDAIQASPLGDNPPAGTMQLTRGWCVSVSPGVQHHRGADLSAGGFLNPCLQACGHLWPIFLQNLPHPGAQARPDSQVGEGMKSRERRETGQSDLFKARLDQIIGMSHPPGESHLTF
jgi:hypothetical protein